MKRLFIISLLLLSTTISFAGNNKSNTIKGKVVDNHGEPIAGATVFLKESNTKVYTDFDGEFYISKPKFEKNTITVSMISFNENKSVVFTSKQQNKAISIKLFSK